MKELCYQVEELWEEVSRLCSIREDKREIDKIFSETQQLEEPQASTAVETQAVSTPNTKGKCNFWRSRRMEAGDLWH